MRIAFSEVALSGEKRLPCDGCGKKLTRRTKVWQTENPYNTNTDGLMKARSEIYAELREELAQWKNEGIVCKDCAKKVWHVRHWYGDTQVDRGVDPKVYAGGGWYDRPDRWGYYSLDSTEQEARAAAFRWFNNERGNR